MKRYDVLVVGSGVAGLSFALKVARKGYEVAILTKKNRAESNTNHAQGGIASVTSSTDDFELHVQDTFRAGDGLCNEEVVKAIVKDGPDAIRELIDVGVDFSQLDDGRVSLHREGGHSKRRILHVHDVTGKAIEDALLHAISESKHIDLYEHYMAIDLITRRRMLKQGHQIPPGEDEVLGLYALDTRKNVVETFGASAIMLATGGIGQVYQYTTNPDIATGDGIAMAWRAGVPIRNMEFVQFHPTAMYSHTGERFLISEAVRGEGAILRNMDEEPFMKRYDDRAELASRDIVARAIDREMKSTGANHMWLDITHKDEAVLRKRFPSIFENCLRQGVNIGKEYIPVVPAAHYLCGGVVTDLDSQTCLKGLYACGEVACTGLHGANRLASNSLLEAVVLANRGAEAVGGFLKQYKNPEMELPHWISKVAKSSDEKVVLKHNLEELKRTMWDYVGIVRTNKRLARAQKRIKNLSQEIQEYYWNFNVDEPMLELRNMIRVADLVVQSALYRHESRGLHYTLDFQDKWDFAHDTTLRRGGVF